MIFLNYSSLTNLDISVWNTSGVDDMSNMFYNCSKLTKVKVSQETYNNMTALAEVNNQTLENYQDINPSIIEIINKK